MEDHAHEHIHIPTQEPTESELFDEDSLDEVELLVDCTLSTDSVTISEES